VSVTAQTLRTGKQTTVHKTFRDSLTMDVLRHGRVNIGYLFFYPDAVAITPNTTSNFGLMERLDELFDIALHDTLISFNRAEIIGGASIEGTTLHNESLARNRAYALRDFLNNRYALSSHLVVDVRWKGEDWEGLTECVRASSVADFPWRNEVLTILSIENANKRDALLRKLDGGRPYAYMLKHFFPYQRRAVITLSCDLQHLAEQRLHRQISPDEMEQVVADALLPADVAKEFLADKNIVSRPVMIPHEGTLRERITDALDRLNAPIHTIEIRHDTITVIKERVNTQADTVIIQTDKRTPYHFAVKTNLLYDAALLPNLALEFPLPGGWSVEAEAQWAWWNTNDSKRYFFRIQSLGLEARRWFGSNRQQPLNGHYLGVYLMGGTYDIRFWQDKGYLSDFSVSAGVSYGYSIHLSRRWNLELGVSVGYLGGKYYRYHFDLANDRYPWESTHRLRYFGPTKAKISLVYRIGALE
jgi:hypothetical protein